MTRNGEKVYSGSGLQSQKEVTKNIPGRNTLEGSKECVKRFTMTGLRMPNKTGWRNFYIPPSNNKMIDNPKHKPTEKELERKIDLILSKAR